MKRTERIFVYSALLLLSAATSLILLSSTGRQAFAEAAAWLDTLGPAESLTLLDGEKQLVLRNDENRLAWGDEPFKRSYTIGFVEINRIMNPLLERPALAEEREKLHSELQAVEDDYKKRLDGFGQQIQGMDRQNPDTQAKVREAQALYEEYMRWGQEAVAKEAALVAQHMQQVYREMVAAVDIVADKLGVDIVLRFNPPDKDFQGTDPESTMTDIRLRSALKLPAGLDITTEVMEELSIQDR